jgi:hypothetical protein
MIVIIDTNSLLSLVRYYLPFDKNSVLYDFIKYKIEQGEIIIIDKVLEECSYNSKGIVIQKLSYLEDKLFLKSAKLPYKTDSLIAPSPAKFLRQVDNQFVNSIVLKQRKLTEVEYENQKNSFLEDADMKLILLSLNLMRDDIDKEVILVTEETETSNDNKLFKKIPAICRELNIKTMSIPELLEKYDGIDVEFK